MTTKPGITIQPLDFDDLDQVVGGRAAMGGVSPETPADGADSEFLASLNRIAAVAASGSASGDGVPRPEAADYRRAAATHRPAMPEDRVPPVQPSPGFEHPPPPADDPGDALGAGAVRRLLRPEAAHDLDVARKRVAAAGMPLILFLPGHDVVRDGFGPLPTTWEDDFARHLGGGTDPAQSLALATTTDEAMWWETHVLRASPMAPETLEATAPHFLTESQTLFEDRRQKIAALFTATSLIAATKSR